MLLRTLIAATLASTVFLSGAAFAAKGDGPSRTLDSHLFGTVGPSPDGATTDQFDIDIGGQQTFVACPAFNEEPPAGQPVLTFDLGAGAEVTAVGWDTLVTAFGASWRSEATVGFYNADGLYLTLAPGTDDSSGGPTAYASGGLVDLSDNGIPNMVLSDGMLRLSFCEGFLDGVNPDGEFTAPSSVTIGCMNCTLGSPDISFDIPNIGFGSTASGGTVPNQFITITNNVDAAGTVLAPVITGPFALVGGTCPAAPFDLAAMSSCTFEVAFTGNAVGNFSGTFTVNAGGADITASLAGSIFVSVPTNSNWALAALIGVLGLVAGLVLVRRNA